MIPIVPGGVSKELALYRAGAILDLSYDLHFSIPKSVSEPILGNVSLCFTLKDTSCPLILDFTGKPDSIRAVKMGDADIDWKLQNEHLIVSAEYLKNGPNKVSIAFIAGDPALNRNEEFLYTLFVPDRARTAFPCFDQPDLKARFALSLQIPASWVAVANGKVREIIPCDERTLYYFEETLPLSTYLFSFVAGKFHKVTRKKGDREISLYHRETNEEYVEQNLDAIFGLTFHSISFLEEYTGIPYPFPKYEFIAIPSFQYSGMEHPGAILYRASRIFLEEATTLEERAIRASLIAHETAHIWFGDLVTMEWFDEVWLKEVFASFIADKIVVTHFPELNHDLRFLLLHYLRAYSIERSEGTHAIEQELANLKDAGTLYGYIIYDKAPIVMAHLEQMVGEGELQEGLREYLKNFAYRNARWNDLIEILDKKTPKDLAGWSKVWVFEAGMPHIYPEIKAGTDSFSLTISQVDPTGHGRIWPQNLVMQLFYSNEVKIVSCWFDEPSKTIVEGRDAPDCILPDGRVYGYFALDEASKVWLLKNIADIKDCSTRGGAWLCLWENMLNGRIKPDDFVAAIHGSLEKEEDEIILQVLLYYLNILFWKFLNAEDQERWAPPIEDRLWAMLQSSDESLRLTYFFAYQEIAYSPSAIANLVKIWKQELEIPGLPLYETQYRQLACEIAVRGVPESQEILERQWESLTNPDSRANMEFVIPALSADPAVRERFFHSLKDEKNREHEAWVVTALHYLHHPLRAGTSQHYILPSLKMLEEIQSTGDIFFPTDWVGQTLHGHKSLAAACIVRKFLEERPNYPAPLRQKILQSADLLFRAAAL